MGLRRAISEKTNFGLGTLMIPINESDFNRFKELYEIAKKNGDEVFTLDGGTVVHTRYAGYVIEYVSHLNATRQPQ